MAEVLRVAEMDQRIGETGCELLAVSLRTGVRILVWHSIALETWRGDRHRYNPLEPGLGDTKVLGSKSCSTCSDGNGSS